MRKLSNKNMIKSLSAIALTGAALGAAVLPAHAQNNVSNQTERLVATQVSGNAQWLNMSQIIDKIEAAGYSDIREVEREGGGYEAKVRDNQGTKVKLYLDPRTGDIINAKSRRDYDD